MRFSLFLGLLATLAVAVDAKPLRRATIHVVHEEKPVARRNWFKTSRLHRTAVIPVRIGLAQQNLDRAEDFIGEVSSPDSPNYGQHWSPEKIIDMFSPKQESVDLVMEWLESEGIHPSRTKLSTAKSWISFDATVREAERLLKTAYHVYRHDSLGHHHVACDKYHVPEHLVEHIDLITPTVHFDQRLGHDRKNKKIPLSEEKETELKKRMVQRRQVNAEHGILGSPNSGNGPKQGATITNALMALDQCDQMITTACLRALYAVPPGTLSSPNNTLGIVEYTPQAFLQADLDMYFREFEPSLVGQPPIVKLIDNGVLQTTNRSFAFNGESALDLEFAMALIFPQRTTLFQVGDLVQGASFNNFLDSVDATYCDFQGGNSRDPNVDGQYGAAVGCGGFAATRVVSTSYSYNEADLGTRYEMRQCAEYMKLGLQGVTVLYSSGDNGVAGNGATCLDPLTGAFNNGSDGIFNPSFPGSCPYVTSVGATQILNGSSVRGAESACQDVIFSGGGFSNVFPIPTYQEEAMRNYYATAKPPYGAERYNNSGTTRGFPDISANGASYVTAVDGKFSLSYGTSGKSARRKIFLKRETWWLTRCVWS